MPSSSVAILACLSPNLRPQVFQQGDGFADVGFLLNRVFWDFAFDGQWSVVADFCSEYRCSLRMGEANIAVIAARDELRSGPHQAQGAPGSDNRCAKMASDRHKSARLLFG